MTIFDLMLAPFFECLILVGIHSYLGLHVIRRRVIFVDLALAQIAGLGTTVGFIFGIMSDSPAGFIYSLTFCLIGAAVFAFTRVRDDRVPQEAVIGLVYAITAALAILVVQKTKGIEHMEGLLVGSLLWVKSSDIISAAIAYSIIGAVHFVFRKQFLMISDNPEMAYRQGMNVRLWDFLFYATFGFVITFSVRVAGVLLVFVFLVAPAILAVMVSDNLKIQLLVGWIIGTVVTVLGLYISYVVDLPCGPTVVVFYGAVLLVAAAVLGIFRAPVRRKALAYTAAGILIFAGVGFGLVLEGKQLATMCEGDHHGHHHGHHHDLAPASSEGTHDHEEEAPGPMEQLDSIREALDRSEGEGLTLLLHFLEDEEVPPFFRDEAVQILRETLHQDFGYRPDRGGGENREALEKIRARVRRRHGGGKRGED